MTFGKLYVFNWKVFNKYRAGMLNNSVRSKWHMLNKKMSNSNLYNSKVTH